jgi:hypothetical protein
MSGGAESAARPATGGGAPAPQPRSGGSTGLKVGGWILLVLGILGVIIGVTLVVIHLTQRDSDGYYTSNSKHFSAPGYAITSDTLHFGDLPGAVSDIVGTVRVRGTSTNGRPLFIGIGRTSDVNSYLGGVARSEVTDINDNSVDYARHPGGPPSGPPGAQHFWQASSSGLGRVTTTWKVSGGDWEIVAMNATGTPRVSADVTLGAKTTAVLWIGIGFLVVGLILAGGGIAMLVAGSRPRY